MKTIHDHEARRMRDQAFVFSRVPSMLTDLEREQLRRIRRMTTDPHVAARCDELLAQEA